MNRIEAAGGKLALSDELMLVCYAGNDGHAYTLQVQPFDHAEILYQWTAPELDDLLAGKYTGPHPEILWHVLELWQEYRRDHAS